MAPYFTNYWKIWGKCKKCVLHIWHLQLESNLKFYLSSSVLLFWIIVVIIITTTTNIIIRMRECVWTNIYGQIESVLTRQEPLCPNPYAADSFPPEKKWIAYICTSLFIHFIYIMCDEVKNIYIHKCTSEHWKKYTTSSLSVVQNGLYCFAAVLNEKPTIWQVPAVCESFAKSVTRRQERGEIQSWVTAWNMQANHEC